MGIAALGFVSVGVRAPTPELGLMMVELLPYWAGGSLGLAATGRCHSGHFVGAHLDRRGEESMSLLDVNNLAVHGPRW